MLRTPIQTVGGGEGDDEWVTVGGNDTVGDSVGDDEGITVGNDDDGGDDGNSVKDGLEVGE